MGVNLQDVSQDKTFWVCARLPVSEERGSSRTTLGVRADLSVLVPPQSCSVLRVLAPRVFLPLHPGALEYLQTPKQRLKVTDGSRFLIPASCSFKKLY